MNRAAYLLLDTVVTPVGVVLAGGGGQSTLLLVNPDDENSLRVATAYAQIRDIPDRNVVFISIPKYQGIPQYGMSWQYFLDYYKTPLVQTLAARGLTDQIDYIAQVGGPATTSSGVSGDGSMSMTHALSILTPVSNGATNTTAWYTESALYQGTDQTAPTSSLLYQEGENYAIHHSQTYATNLGASTQYYMAGRVGFTGMWGTTPEQAIAALERAAASDGTKPQGTIYFEDNDANATYRNREWSAVQQELTARGIPWVQEFETPGGVPQNRSDVRGAVVNTGYPQPPNGSTYLPGAWVDSLQSYGAAFSVADQTKSTEFLKAGAAGTSGTIDEPQGVPWRFTDASIHLFIADGSTLGEAFQKAMNRPIKQMFMGDMLAQPYADVPQVSFTSAPAEGEIISGNSVAIGASASLPVDSNLASGIKELRLYVDGKATGPVISSADGSFSLDTTALSDGRHELRVVALNDAAAESEGYVLRHVVVNNHNRSVSAPALLTVGAVDPAPVSVNASVGDGTAGVTRIELRQLGRSLGSVAGGSGTISLNPTKLAYGANQLVPVAVFADGTEVAGSPIEVTRETPAPIAGQTPMAMAQRSWGVQAEYFYGKGEATIAASDYSGTPDLVQLHGKIALRSEARSFLGPLAPETMPEEANANLDKLAIRLSGRFEVTEETAGEWRFFFQHTNDSAEVMVDGVSLLAFDGRDTGLTTADWGDSIFLGVGEHELSVLASNVELGTGNGVGYYDVAVFARGADGVTRLVDDSMIYQVPEPGSLGVLLTGGLLAVRRQRCAEKSSESKALKRGERR